MPLGYVIFKGFRKTCILPFLRVSFLVLPLPPFFPFGGPGRLVRNEGHLRADELRRKRERGFRFGFALGLLFL